MSSGSAKLSRSEDSEHKLVHITCCPAHPHSFFNLYKHLVLLLSAVSTRDKDDNDNNSFTCLFPPSNFKALHRRENRGREGEAEGTPFPPASQLTEGCAVFFRLPISSQPTMP